MFNRRKPLKKRKRTLVRVGKRSDWKLLFALLAAVTLFGLIANQGAIQSLDLDSSTAKPVASASDSMISAKTQSNQESRPWTTLAGSTPLKRWSNP